MDAGGKEFLKKIVNFGGNQQWYSDCYRPQSEAEILEILQRHPGATIRAIGSGHSWSDVTANADIALDMSALDSVLPVTVNGQELVRAGTGCHLQDLLHRLHALTDRTLPTLGAIKKQTISGAISTGTHGSGRQSLSHFVAAVRMAIFDGETGHWTVREFNEGPQLEAARCGLGCTGIILSVDLQTVPKYMVTETVRTRRNVEEIIGAFAENPLSNFVLSPYGWSFSMFERRAIENRRLSLFERIKTYFFRLYSLLLLDVIFHIGILVCRMLGPFAIRIFLRLAPSTLIKNCERIDDAEHILTTHHYLFRHEEMELFVRESDLARAISFVRTAIETFAAIDQASPDEFRAHLREIGLEQALTEYRGTYTHHYPLFCRRILPDQTMISMTAPADEPMYSISIFTYDPPGRRDPYYAFCRFLAYSLLRLVNARLHWGKHFPFQYGDIAAQYPRLEEFRALCQSHDPDGVLRNGYTRRVLNLPSGRQASATQSPPTANGDHPNG
jgi:L-gulono-1,4-lactone dehydrogenase